MTQLSGKGARESLSDNCGSLTGQSIASAGSRVSRLGTQLLCLTAAERAPFYKLSNGLTRRRARKHAPRRFLQNNVSRAIATTRSEKRTSARNTKTVDVGVLSSAKTQLTYTHTSDRLQPGSPKADRVFVCGTVIANPEIKP